MVDSPVNRVVGDANATAEVRDSLGRLLTLRYPTSFLRMRLARFIGADLQQNQEWWGNAIVALAVTRIDETPVPEARNADQVESVIFKLTDEGMYSVAMWLKDETERRSVSIAAEAKN
jgi:hypothetical protein